MSPDWIPISTENLNDKVITLSFNLSSPSTMFRVKLTSAFVYSGAKSPKAFHNIEENELQNYPN
jgi:hypothetical protein